MNIRALILAPLGLLMSCVIPVNVGSFDTGAAGGGGGAIFFEPCPATGRLQPYRVTLAATEVDDPGCWNGRLVPPNHTLPEDTFEVLVASLPEPDGRTTLGVAGLSPQKLGDVAEVTVGEGVGGQGSAFLWTQIDSVRGPAMADSVQTRTAEGVFQFDRFDTAQTAGTLTLSSRWSCAIGAPPGNAPCGPPPPDVGGCLVTRTFTAEKIGIPERWSVPSTVQLEGARLFLVSLDLGAISRSETRCGIAGQPAPTSRLTPGLRALDVWQATADTVRMVPRGYQLGDAPLIDVGADFAAPPGNAQAWTVSTHPAFDIKETRTTFAALPPRTCGFFTDAGVASEHVLQLQSSYECSGAGCAVDASGNPVRSFCQLDLPWFAISLGEFYSLQSP